MNAGHMGYPRGLRERFLRRASSPLFPWQEYLSLSGRSFSGWTNETGTWSSDGYSLNAAPGAAVAAVARYDASVLIPIPCVIDWEFLMDSASSSGHTAQHMIIGLGIAGTTKGPAAGLKCASNTPASNGSVYAEAMQVAGYAGASYNWPANEWVALRTVITSSAGAQVFRRDACLFSAAGPLGDAGGQYHTLKLYAYSMAVKVRNIRIYTQELPVKSWREGPR